MRRCRPVCSPRKPAETAGRRRRVAGYRLPAALRITVGTEASVRRVLAAIAAFTEATR